jgi:tetratricopeptide (TPR) repeat protein
MTKTLLIILAVVLIVSGIFGTFYFFQVRQAGEQLREALALMQERRYGQAIETLKSAAARYTYPQVQAASMYLLAESHRAQGNTGRAVDIHQSLLSESIVSDTNYWRVKSLLALSQIFRNTSAATPERREQVLQVLLDEVAYLVHTYQENGAFQQGAWWDRLVYTVLFSRDYIFALQLNHRDMLRELRTELGFLHLAGDNVDQAADILRSIETPRARFGLAKVYLRQGRYNEGLAILEDLLGKDETGKVLGFYLEQAFRVAEERAQAGDVTDSVNLYQKVLSRADQAYSDLASFRLAEHYYKLKAYDEALDYLRIALQNESILMDEEATLLKGYILYDQEQYAQALRIFDSFIDTYPSSSLVSTARAWKQMSERVLRYFG